MQRVVLIGDSIRLGYEETVKKNLAGVAQVWSPTDNCQHTVNVLLNFYCWIQQQNPDVVHINAGGWDVRNVVRGVPGNIVPLEQYRENVRRLLELIRQYTRARIIWATITAMDIPANFRNHAATGHPARTEGDIERYNAAALAVTGEMGVPVNDLYGVMMRAGKEKLLCPDGVHLTAEGYEMLGTVVAEAVQREMQRGSAASG